MPTRRTTPAGPLALAALALATAAAPSAAPAQQVDQVILVTDSTVKATGGRVRGTIQAETPAEVRVTLGANNQAIPLDQIASIEYGGKPNSMQLAESRENIGQLAEAVDLYNKAAAEAAGKPFVAQAARFRAAKILGDMALADPSKLDEALQALESFARAHSDGRHFAPALESLARLRLQKEDYSGAEKAVEQLSKLPGAADRAAVLVARVAGRKGDFAKADAALDALIASAPEGSPKRREAQLAKAESLATQQKFSDAEQLLRDLIRSLPPEDDAAQSAAHNTLGDCLRAAGKPKDALYAYLHTDILYPKDREQHPRALAQIVQLWRALKRDDRADEALERLRQEYPQSPHLATATGTK